MPLSTYQEKIVELITHQPGFTNYVVEDDQKTILENLSNDVFGPILIRWKDDQGNFHTWKVGVSKILEQWKSHYHPHTI